MASPKNQHCVNCIGTLSFPMRSIRCGLLSNFIHQRLAEKKKTNKNNRAYTIKPKYNRYATVDYQAVTRVQFTK